MFIGLLQYLGRVPSIAPGIAFGTYPDNNWWVKFSIDISHSLAWNVVQELAHVTNYVSIEERLPTKFYPVSPPPYMNGGPEQFLSWIVESELESFLPDHMLEWLESRLPRPVDQLSEWTEEDDD
ncbi:MAG: hypothetical protein EOO88_23400 [Pedobacter sp.]|nr:MAG: hypothetical protein EOO88_23400 [Pedobacter sp.]